VTPSNNTKQTAAPPPLFREAPVANLQGRRRTALRCLQKKQHETIPSGKLDKALGYLTAHRRKLARHVGDPRLTIDTTSEQRLSTILGKDFPEKSRGNPINRHRISCHP
jgi:hypothetical protein